MARYSLKPSLRAFQKTITALSEIARKVSIEPLSLERDVHIDGCFIRLAVSWECFTEEYFLRCMCGAKTCSGAILRPKVPAFWTTEAAFKRISQKREVREKEYTDWLSPALLKQRVIDYFHPRSRLHRLYESPDRLDSLVIIRNYIAHGSKFSYAKFKRLVINQHGYLKSPNPTSAELLCTTNRKTGQIIFLDIANHFLELAKILAE
jgi:hypothetical protein